MVQYDITSISATVSAPTKTPGRIVVLQYKQPLSAWSAALPLRSDTHPWPHVTPPNEAQSLPLSSLLRSKYYDFMNTQIVHNKTCTYRLPPKRGSSTKAISLPTFARTTFFPEQIGGIGIVRPLPSSIVPSNSDRDFFFSFSRGTYPHADYFQLSQTHRI